MKMSHVQYVFIILISIFSCTESNEFKSNTVMVTMFARNKQHILPYFLSQFENLNYPKNRMSLFIRSDHNSDHTVSLLESWVNYHKDSYHSIDMVLNKTSPEFYYAENSYSNWTAERFSHIIDLKNQALKRAQFIWADYIWFLDMDVLLVDNNVLGKLIDTELPIVAPMLNSLGMYSNFWCGMSEEYWYERTEDYIPILERKKKGCFEVPMVHSSVLVDMTHSLVDHLSFLPKEIPDYTGPIDDIIAFAVGARNIGYKLNVCNNVGYGIIPPPLDENEPISKDFQQLIDVKLQALINHPPMTLSPLFDQYVEIPKKDTLGFDKIYLINLARRSDRRQRMNWSFDVLGLDVEYFEAVDGKKMNSTYLQSLGVKQLDIYKDPYSKRDMTFGEIGCFLSHYFIWQDVVHNQYEKVVIFEDDIAFEPYFRSKIKYMMAQMEQLDLNWDLVYLGRKKLQKSDEPWVDGSDIVIHVDYSYWTLAYVLTLKGAKKLLAPNPLGKMVPVDEYIPIMFNKHPNETWLNSYSPRTLRGFSAEPLMVHPTHYTGDDGYISDTENSVIVDDIVKEISTSPERAMGHENIRVNTEL